MLLNDYFLIHTPTTTRRMMTKVNACDLHDWILHGLWLYICLQSCIIFLFVLRWSDTKRMMIKLNTCDLRNWLLFSLQLSLWLQSCTIFLFVLLWPNSDIQLRLGSDIANLHKYFTTVCFLMVDKCFPLCDKITFGESIYLNYTHIRHNITG